MAATRLNSARWLTSPMAMQSASLSTSDRSAQPRRRIRAATECAGRLDHDLAEVCWRADTTEAEVNGWLTGIKEGIQLGESG